jgi:thioesterase domain-containing protein
MQASLMTHSLQERILAEIPLASAMGVEVRSSSGDEVVLTAPLAPNINHKNTAFGGSVHSVAVLACWALVTTVLQEEGLDSDYVVIQDSRIDYRTPVDGNFEAWAGWDSESSKEKFLDTLRRRGRARASLCATVSTDSRVCAELQARFAAQIKRKK